MFQRNVRFHVNITPAGGGGCHDKSKDTQQAEKSIIYAITFTLITGKKKDKRKMVAFCEAFIIKKTRFLFAMLFFIANINKANSCVCKPVAQQLISFFN